MSNKIGISAIIISLVSLCCSAVCLVFALNANGSTKNEPAAAQSDNGTAVQYVMYVGTNDKDTYKLEHTQEEARKIVDEVCLKYFEARDMGNDRNRISASGS